MIRIYPETDLYKVASTITSDSEIFGDETMIIVGYLAQILRTAETFGLVFTDQIDDLWGGKVTVTAYPSTRRHHWTF